jgi:hypothetical protein
MVGARVHLGYQLRVAVSGRFLVPTSVRLGDSGRRKLGGRGSADGGEGEREKLPLVRDARGWLWVMSIPSGGASVTMVGGSAGRVYRPSELWRRSRM